MSELYHPAVNKFGRLNRRDCVIIAMLVVGIAGLYFQTRHFDFIDYDDPLYVSQNPVVLSGLNGQSVRWSMTAIVTGNWHPLTMLTELLISNTFGPYAKAFHLCNASIHAANTALLYLFLSRSTHRAWPSFFASIFWGFHPLRVESVAWVSELKDVLCGFFWLACMLAYLRYSRHRTLVNYILVIALQTLALLAKPMAATLPAVLLLTDYWPIRDNNGAPRNRQWWFSRILEKLPMLAVSVADMCYALRTQTTARLSASLPLSIRFSNAITAYVYYLRDIFFPRHLIVFYPHPAMVGVNIPAIAVLFTGTVLFLFTILALLTRSSKPYLLVGWLWFVGTLLPVIGLVQIGVQSRADRYTYLPSIGISFVFVWMIDDAVAGRRHLRIVSTAMLTLVVLALSIVTASTIGHWRNTDTLFGYVRQIQPNNYLALTFYSQQLAREGQTAQAIEIGEKAAGIAPESADAHGCYAATLWKAGKLSQAQSEFVKALSLDGTIAAYWDGLGAVRDSEANQCAAKKDAAEKDLRLRAIGDFQTAIRLQPGMTAAREHLAYQLALLGRLDDAIAVWEQAVAIEPAYSRAQGDLATALLARGNVAGAIEHYNAALASGSKNPDWETRLAYLVGTRPQSSTADIEQMVTVATNARDQTEGADPAAVDALAVCLARLGRFDDAVATAEIARRQAARLGQTTLERAIQKRLALYNHGQPYIGGPT